MPICNVCTGSEFICDSGFFFCMECQTQSQEVQEVVTVDDFDEGDDHGIHEKTIPKQPENEEIENMTSWEGFNFSLIGLTKQLVYLGAKPSIKQTVLQIWSKYLGKMEIAFFSRTPGEVPKLGPNYKKTDAFIIYGYSRCKKKSTNESNESSVSDEDEVDIAEVAVEDISSPKFRLARRSALKRKRKILDEECSKIIDSLAQTSQALTNVTLEMLSNTEAEASDTPDISQPMNDNDFEKWLSEVDVTRGKLYAHPGLLVRNRLIAILYLAMLRTEEEIQLSDILRWINEGHIWYGRLTEFFPKEACLRSDNADLFKYYQPRPPYHILLDIVGRLAHFIGIKYLPIPDIKSLIQRFVEELNLPYQVGLLAERLVNLLPRQEKRLKISNSSFPNWEARAMAHILIAMKLVLGLDDASEERSSGVAKKINEKLESSGYDKKLFVWSEWEKFTNFKRTAFCVYNVPGYLKYAPMCYTTQTSQHFWNEWNKYDRNPTFELSRRASMMINSQKHFVEQLKINDDKSTENPSLYFPSTLNPSRTYSKVILENFGSHEVESSVIDDKRCLKVDRLSTDFTSSSIEYLTHPEQYVEWAQSCGIDTGLHSGSAVSRIWTENVDEKGSLPNVKTECRVKVYFNVQDLMAPFSTMARNPLQQKPREDIRVAKLHKPIISLPKAVSSTPSQCAPPPRLQDLNLCDVDSSPKPLPKKAGRKKLVPKSYVDLEISEDDSQKMIYTPFIEYWMVHFSSDNPTVFAKNVSKIPGSFLRLLKECAFVLQMEPWVLYKEVIFLELLHSDLFEEKSKTAQFVPLLKSKW